MVYLLGMPNSYSVCTEYVHVHVHVCIAWPRTCSTCVCGIHTIHSVYTECTVEYPLPTHSMGMYLLCNTEYTPAQQGVVGACMLYTCYLLCMHRVWHAMACYVCITHSPFCSTEWSTLLRRVYVPSTDGVYSSRSMVGPEWSILLYCYSAMQSVRYTSKECGESMPYSILLYYPHPWVYGMLWVPSTHSVLHRVYCTSRVE
jgi:hypothetical protein